MIQGSEEWHEARRGKATASNIIKIVPGRSGYKAERANYMSEIICEILTGQTAEGYVSPAMIWGTEHEPTARTTYEIKTGNLVDEVGFVDHPEIVGLGGSPDGLVGLDGMVEIKCPNTATHIDTIMTGKIKPDYLYQIHTCLMCTGRNWCDFVSYDPRLPAPQDLYIKRVYADPMMFATIKVEVQKFLAEMNLKLQAVRSYEG